MTFPKGFDPSTNTWVRPNNDDDNNNVISKNSIIPYKEFKHPTL
jgi:hypothetical protein